MGTIVSQHILYISIPNARLGQDFECTSQISAYLNISIPYNE